MENQIGNEITNDNNIIILSKNINNLSKNSDAIIRVLCDKCCIEYKIKYNQYILHKENDLCINCDMDNKEKYLNSTFIEELPEYNYFLGFLLNSRVDFLEDGIKLYIDEKNRDGRIIYIITHLFKNYEILEDCSPIYHIFIKDKNVKNKFYQIIHSDELNRIIDNIKDVNNKWIFIRGLFEANSYIDNSNKTIRCSFNFTYLEIMQNFIQFCSIPKDFSNRDCIVYYNTNCIDFMGNLYYSIKSYDKLNKKISYEKLFNNIDITDYLFNNYHYEKYHELLKFERIDNCIPICNVLKVDVNAIIPSKKVISDVGYDLTIIKKVKQINSATALYDTGLRINIEDGYYTEIVARSSLIKSGYILTNCIGIIEKSYSNNLFISLTKISLEAATIGSDELPLPFRCCQLIIRKQFYTNMVEVTEDEYKNNTTRGAGGIGSTN
jgi:dUTPase